MTDCAQRDMAANPKQYRTARRRCDLSISLSLLPPHVSAPSLALFLTAC